MLRYPIRVKRQPEKKALLSVPDLPGAELIAANRQEALEKAQGLLEASLMRLLKDGAEIPLPSPMRSGAFVELSEEQEAKLLLYRAMRSRGVTKAQLARRLKSSVAEMDKLLDLGRKSSLAQMQKAFAALKEAS